MNEQKKDLIKKILDRNISEEELERCLLEQEETGIQGFYGGKYPNEGMDINSYLKTLYIPETQRSRIIYGIIAGIIITIALAFGVYNILDILALV